MPGSIASAYVQIIPTTEGITANLENELGGAGESSGKSFGSKFSSALKTIISAAAIGQVIKKSLTEGMELEQNLGGTEAVFGAFADSIQSKASEAYKNMGMSASDYMATANKMGSLFQGSGLEQVRAMELSSQAMQRAADVASVMGITTESAMESIAGAAKGNFTMMDNLGVAMNATTLEAYALEKGMSDFSYATATNAEKAELAMQMFFDRTQQYEDNFARESATTISGSLGAMKGAFSDVLGNMALGNDIMPSLQNLQGTIVTFATNITPAVSSIVTTLPTALISTFSALAPQLVSMAAGMIGSIADGLASAMPELSTAIAGAIPVIITAFAAAAPSLLGSGVSILLAIIEGITSAIPQLAAAIPEITNTVIDTLISAAPQLLMAAVQLFMAIVQALPQIIAAVGNGVVSLIVTVVNRLVSGVGQLASAAKSLFQTIVTAAGSIASSVISKVKTAVTGAINAVKGFVGDMVAAGRNLFLGLANGIGNAVGAVIAKAKAAAAKVVGAVKGFFGIASPSKLFRDEIGRYLMLGLADGIEGNTKPVKTAIDSIAAITAGGFESELAISTALGKSADTDTTGGLQTLIALVAELSRKIEQLEIRLDSGELVGGLIQKTNDALGSRDVLEARGVC